MSTQSAKGKYNRLNKRENMKTLDTNLKKVKDLYMTYSAILAGNWIGDLDAIEDQIADLCEKSNIDLLEVIAKIDNENLN